MRIPRGRAAPAIPALKKALHKPSNRLLRISPTIGDALIAATEGAAKLEADFVAQLRGGSMESRMQALEALGRLAPADDAEPSTLRRRLKGGAVEERLAAAARLSRAELVGKERAKSLSALNAALLDDSDDVRFVALAVRLSLEWKGGKPEEAAAGASARLDPELVANTRKALARPDTSEAFRQLAVLVEPGKAGEGPATEAGR